MLMAGLASWEEVKSEYGQPWPNPFSPIEDFSNDVSSRYFIRTQMQNTKPNALGL